MVSRVPRIRRKYKTVFSYRAELLYGRRFAKKEADEDRAGKPGGRLSLIGRRVRYMI